MTNGSSASEYTVGLRSRVQGYLVTRKRQTPEVAARLTAALVRQLEHRAADALAISRGDIGREHNGALEAMREVRTSLTDLLDRHGNAISVHLRTEVCSEVARLDEVLEGAGHARARKNRAYDTALVTITGLLRLHSVAYAATEAVAVLWHAGYSQLQNEMDVIDPYSARGTPGKDSRDPIEQKARTRMKRFQAACHRRWLKISESHPVITPDHASQPPPDMPGHTLGQ